MNSGTRTTTGRTPALTLGALGVVFGDIGTSPLYTIQTVFSPGEPHPVESTTQHVYGVISLIFWAVTAFFSLAAVVLAVTGAEALYADMGHFGRPPIARAWLVVVFPACILNYLGQGALVLDDPASSVSSPFYLLVPEWGRLPMVVLATAATVIASQAVITGAFSVAHQAVQLGICHGYAPGTRPPRLSGRSTCRGSTGP